MSEPAEPTPGTEDLREAQALDRAASRMTLVLRGGLLTALALIVASIALLLAEDPSGTDGRVVSARTLSGYLGGSGLVPGLLAGVPEAYLTLGIYALIATPVLRVVTGVYYFRLARDRPMTRLALLVLGMLLLSMLLVGPLLR